MVLEEVAYCGLYCGLCASRRRIPQQAAALRETLRREGYDRGYFDTLMSSIAKRWHIDKILPI
ncbi:MAG: hypothetical protein NUW24_12000, partial [Anaerolineae bacterium]|nr:hypothetical protein [Anaerolineae bacterium]